MKGYSINVIDFIIFQIRRNKDMPDRLNVKNFIHGGDYNPDRWTDRPEIIAKDFEMFKEAKINSVTVGIFAWDKLEPSEGTYDFSWLDDVFDRAENKAVTRSCQLRAGHDHAGWLKNIPKSCALTKQADVSFSANVTIIATRRPFTEKSSGNQPQARRTLRQTRKPRFVAHFK